MENRINNLLSSLIQSQGISQSSPPHNTSQNPQTLSDPRIPSESPSSSSIPTSLPTQLASLASFLDHDDVALIQNFFNRISSHHSPLSMLTELNNMAEEFQGYLSQSENAASDPTWTSSLSKMGFLRGSSQWERTLKAVGNLNKLSLRKECLEGIIKGLIEPVFNVFSEKSSKENAPCLSKVDMEYSENLSGNNGNNEGQNGHTNPDRRFIQFKIPFQEDEGHKDQMRPEEEEQGTLKIYKIVLQCDPNPYTKYLKDFYTPVITSLDNLAQNKGYFESFRTHLSAFTQGKVTYNNLPYHVRMSMAILYLYIYLSWNAECPVGASYSKYGHIHRLWDLWKPQDFFIVGDGGLLRYELCTLTVYAQEVTMHTAYPPTELPKHVLISLQEVYLFFRAFWAVFPAQETQRVGRGLWEVIKGML